MSIIEYRQTNATVAIVIEVVDKFWIDDTGGCDVVRGLGQRTVLSR